MSDQTNMALHWLLVGYVSPGAKEWIIKVGGQVRDVSSDPPLVAVGLAYHPEGAWTWSKGRKEHREGIEYWSSGELQEASTGITLQYRSWKDEWTLTEYCSADGIYLVLPDEEFDPETLQTKKADPQERVPDDQALASADDDLGDLDEAPF